MIGRYRSKRAGVLILAGAAVSLLVVRPAPGYDAWMWLLWGREVLGGGLSTVDGPAFKPLPVAVCALLAPLGGAAPWAWVAIVRVAAVAAIWLAFRLGRDLASGWGAAPSGAGARIAGGALAPRGRRPRARRRRRPRGGRRRAVPAGSRSRRRRARRRRSSSRSASRGWRRGGAGGCRSRSPAAPRARCCAWRRGRSSPWRAWSPGAAASGGGSRRSRSRSRQRGSCRSGSARAIRCAPAPARGSRCPASPRWPTCPRSPRSRPRLASRSGRCSPGCCSCAVGAARCWSPGPALPGWL